jgi:hypothetical protein
MLAYSGTVQYRSTYVFFCVTEISQKYHICAQFGYTKNIFRSMLYDSE